MENHEKKYGGFDLQLYTRYIMDDDAEKRTGEIIKEFGGTKVLLVYDITVKMLGLDKTVLESLDKAGVAYCEMPDGVVPNPRRSLIEKGVDFAKENGVDFVLGMGGGSTIDTTKGICIGIGYDGPVWDILGHKVMPDPKTKVPCGIIPTIAASGSEGSRACVIKDDIGSGRKDGGFGGPFNRPHFVIMNPKLTFTVPAKQTASGAVDAFGHTFERYFMPYECHLADEFCFGLMRNVVKYSVIAYKDPTNYEARRELQLCALFGHNDITELGRHGGQHGGAHDLANIVDGKLDMPHGFAVSMGYCPWLEYIAEKGNDFQVGKAARFATEVFGVPADFENPRDVVKEGIKRLAAWLRELNMPLTFSDAGIDPESVTLDEFLSYIHWGPDGTFTKFLVLTRDDVAEMARKILQ